MSDKLTDNEIIKALGNCLHRGCNVCIRRPEEYGATERQCSRGLMKDALSLINRQKAEIERLQTENKLLTDNHPANTHSNCVAVDNGLIFTKTLADYDKLIGDIAHEAIKEFAKYLLDNYASGGVISAVDVVGAVVDWGTSSG
ncbi:MAG: hypothetical protein IK954_02420 [Clostridia bacterium]|nr:hypothetical protein [Clostridia bacterium]